MKRGLVVLDERDVPGGVRDARVDAVRRDLAARDLDAACIYASVFRSDDVAHLTNLTIYWNEGVLVVPRQGEPIFLTKLSPRTHPWMRAVSTLTELRSGKDLAALVAGVAAELDVENIGVVDEEWWPAQLLEQVRANAVGSTVPLPGLVSNLRAVPDQAEQALLGRASNLARRSVAVALDASDPHDAMAALELEARGGGATDVMGDVLSVGGTLCAHVVVQYRGVWAEEGGIAEGAASPPPWLQACREAFEGALGALHAGVTLDAPTGAVEQTLAGSGLVWELRCDSHVDIGTRGDLRVVARAPLQTGAVVALALEVVGPEGLVVVARTIEVGVDGARSLADLVETSSAKE